MTTGTKPTSPKERPNPSRSPRSESLGSPMRRSVSSPTTPGDDAGGRPRGRKGDKGDRPPRFFCIDTTTGDERGPESENLNQRKWGFPQGDSMMQHSFSGTDAGEFSCEKPDSDALSGPYLLRTLLVQQSQHERRLKKLLERHRQQVTSAVTRTLDGKLRQMADGFHVNAAFSNFSQATSSSVATDAMPLLKSQISIPEIVIAKEGESAQKFLANGDDSYVSQIHPVGTKVEYFSSSSASWIPAVVQGYVTQTACYQLDVHPRAPQDKVRLVASPLTGSIFDVESHIDKAKDQNALEERPSSHTSFSPREQRYQSALKEKQSSLSNDWDSPREEQRESDNDDASSQQGPRGAARQTETWKSRPSSMKVRKTARQTTVQGRQTVGFASNRDSERSAGETSHSLASSRKSTKGRFLLNHKTAKNSKTFQTLAINDVMREMRTKELRGVTKSLNYGAASSSDLMALRSNSWADFQDNVWELTHNRKFDLLVASIILMNAIVIGAQSDWAIKNAGEELPVVYSYFFFFFTSAFTIEIILRIIGEGREFLSRYNKQIKWNLFDTLLVLASHAEWILNSLDSEVVGIGLIRVVRTLRLVRVIRIVRVLRFFRDLQQMVMGIISSLRSLMWCLLLLLLLMFLVAVVILHVLTEQLERDPDNEVLQNSEIMGRFESLISTIYTLYMSITGGVDWGFDVVVPLLALPDHSGIFIACLFAVWIAFAVFCVLNIVTGVFVENANKLALANGDHVIMEELANRRSWYEEVQPAFSQADEDNTGELDWTQFKATIKNESVRDFFCRAGLDVDTHTSLRGLFHLLDFDGNGRVGVDELYIGGSQLLGPARALDVARIRHENWAMHRRMVDLWDLCQTAFDGMDRLRSFEDDDPDEDYGRDPDASWVVESAQIPEASENNENSADLRANQHFRRGAPALSEMQSSQEQSVPNPSATVKQLSVGQQLSVGKQVSIGKSAVVNPTARSSVMSNRSFQMSESEYKKQDRERLARMVGAQKASPGMDVPSLSPRPLPGQPGEEFSPANPGPTPPTSTSNTRLQAPKKQAAKFLSS